MKSILYTDGSSRGNPGKGGWGFILIEGETVREFGGASPHTTNNRMELIAAIEGLTHVSGEAKEVALHTDSEYVVKGITSWIHNWIKLGWKTAAKKMVLNKDLWAGLHDEKNKLEERGVEVKFIYVRGHSGVTLNERADLIATSFADGEPVTLYNGPKKDYIF